MGFVLFCLFLFCTRFCSVFHSAFPICLCVNSHCSIPGTTTAVPSQEPQPSPTTSTTASFTSEETDLTSQTSPSSKVTNHFRAVYPRLDQLEPGIKEMLRENPMDRVWSSRSWKRKVENKSPRDVPRNKRCKLADEYGPSCKSECL